MDRSFLAFRQFLSRLISTTEDTRNVREATEHGSDDQPRLEAEVPKDWARIEL